MEQNLICLRFLCLSPPALLRFLLFFSVREMREAENVPCRIQLSFRSHCLTILGLGPRGLNVIFFFSIFVELRFFSSK